MAKKTVVLLALLVLCVGMTGCANTIEAQNKQYIAAGYTYEGVMKYFTDLYNLGLISDADAANIDAVAKPALGYLELWKADLEAGRLDAASANYKLFNDLLDKLIQMQLDKQKKGGG